MGVGGAGGSAAASCQPPPAFGNAPASVMHAVHGANFWTRARRGRARWMHGAADVGETKANGVKIILLRTVRGLNGDRIPFVFRVFGDRLQGRFLGKGFCRRACSLVQNLASFLVLNLASFLVENVGLFCPKKARCFFRNQNRNQSHFRVIFAGPAPARLQEWNPSIF